MMAGSGAVVVLFLCSVISSSDAADCLTLQATCAGDPVCGPLQSAYLSACFSAFAASGGLCSQACKTSYDTLLGNSIGAQYYQCNCGASTLCSTYATNLLNNCFNGVAPSPSTVISATRQSPIATVKCAAAQISCSSNRACGSLLLAYVQACMSAFLGVNCSQLCSDSFYDLLRHPVGSQFYGCQCGNDTQCQMSGMNLGRTCYNGSFPVAPTVVVPPTVFAPGTCESFHELCFEREYLTCGSLFTLVHGGCRSSLNVSQNITCSRGCESGLQSLLNNVPRARDVLACNCINSSSSMCQPVIDIQRLFSVCGVSAKTDQSTSALPSAPTTSYPTARGDPGPSPTARGGPGPSPTVKEGGPGKAGNVEASLLIVFTSLVFAHLLLIA